MIKNEQQKQIAEMSYDKYDFKYDTKDYEVIFNKGLNEDVVREISKIKNEPSWMTELRIKGYKSFMQKVMPEWGADLKDINFENIIYYMRSSKASNKSWEDVPEYVKQTFDKLGIPDAERKFLAGVGAQFDSEVVYHSIKKELEDKGVVFLSMDEGLRQYPELVKKYFNTIIPFNDNKFAALNTAVWSGGSFVYVPKNVKLDVPLQAYFRINAADIGQFERTLIIVDEGAQVHYIEGCFTKGTPIVTKDGVKNIEDVKEGDYVLTHNSRYKKVYNTQKRKYNGKLYNLGYYGDSTQKISATEEHPFLVSKKEKQEYSNKKWLIEWQTASQLKKGDYLAIPIDRTVETNDEREFTIKLGKGRHGFKDVKVKIKTDKDFFRLIGYYLAEGSASKEHYLTFTFNKNEKENIDDVRNLIAKYFGKEPDVSKEYKNGIGVRLNSTLAARFFINNFGKHAGKKSLPEWAVKESVEKQAELIKGYWRGDGSFMYKVYPGGTKRMFRINTISEKLAQQIRDVMLRLNIFASINISKRSQKYANKSDMYTLYIGGKALELFSEIVGLYQTINVDNKYVMLGKMISEQVVSYAHIAGNYAFVPIKSIEEKDVNDIDVYNFGVEEDESYTAGFVAVHNCTAPRYSSQSLHSAVVEIIALPGSHVRYTTIQNWANNIYNLVTKRAYAYKNATVEWVDGNLGSKVTMKYPSIYLLDEGAKGEVLSIALAGKGQHQDAGAKIIHLAPNTTSTITSKSISKSGGRASYRGLLKVYPGAKNVKSSVRCDALLLDKDSRTDTYPSIEIDEPSTTITHEATVGKIGEDQLFYLQSRGLKQEEALAMIVLGFIQPFTKSLPMEYSVELNRLIELEMEGSVG